MRPYAGEGERMRIPTHREGSTPRAVEAGVSARKPVSLPEGNSKVRPDVESPCQSSGQGQGIEGLNRDRPLTYDKHFLNLRTLEDE